MLSDADCHGFAHDLLAEPTGLPVALPEGAPPNFRKRYVKNEHYKNSRPASQRQHEPL